MNKSQKFLDQIGVNYLWEKLQDQLKKKTSIEDFASLDNRVKKIETSDIILFGGNASDAVKEGNN